MGECGITHMGECGNTHMGECGITHMGECGITDIYLRKGTCKTIFFIHLLWEMGTVCHRNLITGP